MECKFNTKCEQCGDYYEAKRLTSKYCSAKCRVTASRVSVTEPIKKVSVTTRANPDDLNYGEYMTKSELDKAGLKANRVPIPGDSDYIGVCEQVGGVWKIAS